MKLPEHYVSGRAVKKATAMGGFGQHMLECMGWREGEGLGKDKQGRAAPVETKKKDCTTGIGARCVWDWSHDYAGSALDAALASIAGSSDGSSSSSDSSDDDEIVCARNRDGTVSSASTSELKLARDLARDNNLGRFGASAGKVARIREQEAKLAEATALTRPAAFHATATGLKDKRRVERSAPAKRNVIVVELSGCAGDGMPLTPPRPQGDGWWGTKTFESAGWLDNIESESLNRERHKFTEDTQEDICNQLRNQQSKVPHCPSPPLACQC
jgi:hypothetical protein